ncbi:DUF7344 domain-containing protein [Halomicrococcus sp. NG-SE-24]|uniref:DUF7344 domain-containing protein n=1 Tax=Halomicrococcus sp. NG-SE-24 TaxID=3436928 RepID=UPI003D9532EE
MTRCTVHNDASGVSVDDAMDALAARRRRVLLAHLFEERRATVGELADELVDDSRGTDPLRVRTELVHVDLPRLTDAGIVAFDRDADTVSLDGELPLVRRSLEAARRHEGRT